jgi:hypothetical protein
MGEMTQNTFSLPITYEMAPKARMIAHYIRSDGEIVSDALTTKRDKQLIVPLEHKDGPHVMLNLSRESQKRIHSFKLSLQR